jgi:hypothetical protein
MKSKKMQNLFLLAIITSFFCITTGYTSTMTKLSLQELCQSSDHIILAKTIACKSYYKTAYKRIYTDVTLEVIDTFKGRLQKQEQLTITVLGGTVDGITTLVVGGPQYKINEKSIFFLVEQLSQSLKQYYFATNGWSQGKFDIITDAQTNEEKVIRKNTMLPLLLETNGDFLPIADSQSLGIAAFLQHINLYIK